MTEELKPCPFCGGRRITRIRGEEAHWYRCESCDATGPLMRKRDGEGEPIWNTRASTLPDLTELRRLSEGATVQADWIYEVEGGHVCLVDSETGAVIGNLTVNSDFTGDQDMRHAAAICSAVNLVRQLLAEDRG